MEKLTSAGCTACTRCKTLPIYLYTLQVVLGRKIQLIKVDACSREQAKRHARSAGCLVIWCSNSNIPTLVPSIDKRPAVCLECGVRATKYTEPCKHGHNNWVRQHDVTNTTKKFWDSVLQADMSVEDYIARFYLTNDDIPWKAGALPL